MQESFRQQYSKFGNTREQYFHAWRSFHFDEATDTIDGYIQKVKQVAALLNYGDPQILELFKNTLLSRLYYMLYQINDLRMAVETAKRLITKEQMDKKSGQSTASPFMKSNSENSKSKNEKKVSFSTVKAIERTSGSIERLASLMDKMDTKLNRRDNQYRPRITKVEVEAMVIGKTTIDPEIDLIAEIITSTEEEEIILVIEITEITGPITETTAGPEIEIIIEMEIGIIIDQITDGTIVSKGIGIEM